MCTRTESAGVSAATWTGANGRLVWRIERLAGVTRARSALRRNAIGAERVRDRAGSSESSRPRCKVPRNSRAAP